MSLREAANQTGLIQAGGSLEEEEGGQGRQRQKQDWMGERWNCLVLPICASLWISVPSPFRISPLESHLECDHSNLAYLIQGKLFLLSMICIFCIWLLGRETIANQYSIKPLKVCTVRTCKFWCKFLKDMVKYKLLEFWDDKISPLTIISHHTFSPTLLKDQHAKHCLFPGLPLEFLSLLFSIPYFYKEIALFSLLKIHGTQFSLEYIRPKAFNHIYIIA